EFAFEIEHVRIAARHPGGEVAPGGAKHHDDPAGHVLAAVVADALDHCDRARVAHGKSLSGDAPEVRLAGDRAVEHHVAGDDVLGARRGTWARAAPRFARPRAPWRSSRWCRP